jgi:hypothetical protein
VGRRRRRAITRHQALAGIAENFLGHVALGHTKDGRIGGRGMAVTGLTLGYVTVAPAIILFFTVGLGMIGTMFAGTA